MPDNDDEIYQKLIDQLSEEILPIMDRYSKQIENSDLNQAEWMITFMPQLAANILGNVFCYMNFAYIELSSEKPKNEEEKLGAYVTIGKRVVAAAIASIPSITNLSENPPDTSDKAQAPSP